jgi:hypothetical protein
MAKQEMKDWAARHQVKQESRFVPHSKSRNAGAEPCLNWDVRVSGRFGALTIPYSQGRGHCPSYRRRETVNSRANVDRECETGKTFAASGPTAVRKLSPPNLADILCALALDSRVLYFATFEGWADSLGYNSDSRKALVIYNTCLAIALKLRCAIGDIALSELRTAVEGY